MRVSACSEKAYFNKAGYTLIELIVVLALLVIVIGISVPKFTRMMDDTNVGSSARRLAGEVLYIRNLAAKNSRVFYLNIDFAENSYSIMVKKPLTEIELPENIEYLYDYEYERALKKAMYKEYKDEFVGKTKLKRKVMFLDVILAEDKIIEEESVKIALYPDGTSDKATIHFTNPKNDYYTVEIRPLTARPYVTDNYTEPTPEVKFDYENGEQEDED